MGHPCPNGMLLASWEGSFVMLVEYIVGFVNLVYFLVLKSMFFCVDKLVCSFYCKVIEN